MTSTACRMTKKVRERPQYDELLPEVAAGSWSAVARKYGVSDDAVRRWVGAYEEAA
jgi:transposase-like protein